MSDPELVSAQQKEINRLHEDLTQTSSHLATLELRVGLCYLATLKLRVGLRNLATLELIKGRLTSLGNYRDNSKIAPLENSRTKGRLTLLGNFVTVLTVCYILCYPRYSK